MIRRLIVSTAAIAALTGAALAPALADEAQEVMTAGQHAGMAAGSADIKMVHMHLHHVVNCIVGPSGEGFDKTAGNPCDGKGNGAEMDAGPDKKAWFDGILAKAWDGIKSDDLATAKKDAGDIQATLTK